MTRRGKAFLAFAAQVGPLPTGALATAASTSLPVTDRRRQSRDAESLILSAPTAAAGAAATGLTRSRASQVRTAAGISTQVGRPRSATSTRTLQALGARVVADSTTVGLSADEYLDRAQARSLQLGVPFDPRV